MTYIVITPDRRQPDIRDGAPSPERLSDLVGGLPEKVGTSLGGSAVMWVNDDFVALGLERNILGTVLASVLGAPLQPYAGTVVITGLVTDPMEGYIATELQPDVAMVIEAALHDGSVVVGLHECELLDVDIPADLRQKLLDAAHLARTGHVPPPQYFTIG
jgi:hypothetical protein